MMPRRRGATHPPYELFMDELLRILLSRNLSGATLHSADGLGSRRPHCYSRFAEPHIVISASLVGTDHRDLRLEVLCERDRRIRCSRSLGFARRFGKTRPRGAFLSVWAGMFAFRGLQRLSAGHVVSLR